MPEERGGGDAVWDVVATDREDAAAGGHDAAGDLVHDALVALAVRADGAAVVEAALDQVVDVDEQRVDGAEGGRAGHVRQVGGGTATRLPGLEAVAQRGELLGVER